MTSLKIQHFGESDNTGPIAVNKQTGGQSTDPKVEAESATTDKRTSSRNTERADYLGLHTGKARTASPKAQELKDADTKKKAAPKREKKKTTEEKHETTTTETLQERADEDQDKDQPPTENHKEAQDQAPLETIKIVRYTDPELVAEVARLKKTNNNMLTSLKEAIARADALEDQLKMVQRKNGELSEKASNNEKTIYQNNNLKEQMETLEASLSGAVTQSREQEDELVSTRNEVKALKSTNEDLRTKLADTEAMNDRLLNRLVEKDPPKGPIKATKPKVLIIGDSNVQLTKPELHREKAVWTVTNQIFKVTELVRALDDTHLTDQAKRNDKVNIHLATNDLRTNTTEAEAHTKLEWAAATIHERTGVPVYISEIPPSSDPELGAKSAVFNNMVAKHTTAKGVQVQHVSSYYKEYTYRDILSKKDSFHLNKTGQEVLARQFEATASKDETRDHQNKTPKAQKSKTTDQKKTPETRKSPTDPTIGTTVISTRPELMRFVVGKKGAKVKQLEEDHNARIRITGSKIQIKAPHEDMRRAESAIKKILEDMDKDEKPQVCHFFTKGTCTFGPKCRNLHTKKRGRSPNPGNTANSRRPSASQGAANTHKSRSPPRKRLELGAKNPFETLE